MSCIANSLACETTTSLHTIVTHADFFGLSPAGLNAWWEISSNFYMVSQWIVVNLRMVMKHWILSGIVSSPARAFICTLDQENCSSFTGVSCRDLAFFPATKEVSHQDQKGNFPEHLSKSVKKADAHNQNRVLYDVTLHGRCWRAYNEMQLWCHFGISGHHSWPRLHLSLGCSLDIVLIPGYNITVLWVLCTIHGLLQKTNAPLETCPQIWAKHRGSLNSRLKY